MSTNTIITIERQYGSGGHLIGEKLAESLGIPFYDSELIKVAAKESGICEEIFESFDEKPTTSFLYSLVMDPYSLGYNSNSFDLPLNHKVFLAASKRTSASQKRKVVLSPEKYLESSGLGISNERDKVTIFNIVSLYSPLAHQASSFLRMISWRLSESCDCKVSFPSSSSMQPRSMRAIDL